MAFGTVADDVSVCFRKGRVVVVGGGEVLLVLVLWDFNHQSNGLTFASLEQTACDVVDLFASRPHSHIGTIGAANTVLGASHI